VEELAVLDEGHLPDGLAVAADGTLYVAAIASGGVDLVAGTGGVVGFLAVGAVPTNCAFDDTTLYVTDAGRPGESAGASSVGALWAVELDVAGQQVFRGRAVAQR
jgi:sugar lactone lactonase YvrE